MRTPIYCKEDNTYHYKSELPKTLQSFVNYVFSSGAFAGNDFKSFDTKYRNAIKKLLPEGYVIHSWHRSHYQSSAVIRSSQGNFIYLSYFDVRFFPNEWFSNILIRTMKHDGDWDGGPNHYTTLFTLTKDIAALTD